MVLLLFLPRNARRAAYDVQNHVIPPWLAFNKGVCSVLWARIPTFWRFEAVGVGGKYFASNSEAMTTMVQKTIPRAR